MKNLRVTKGTQSQETTGEGGTGGGKTPRLSSYGIIPEAGLPK